MFSNVEITHAVSVFNAGVPPVGGVRRQGGAVTSGPQLHTQSTVLHQLRSGIVKVHFHFLGFG